MFSSISITFPSVGDSSGQSEPLLSSFDDPVTAVSISLQHGYHLVREEDEHNLINDEQHQPMGSNSIDGGDASATTVLYDYDDEVKFHLNTGDACAMMKCVVCRVIKHENNIVVWEAFVYIKYRLDAFNGELYVYVYVHIINLKSSRI